jgi:predicted PurR-regulated permease PerM
MSDRKPTILVDGIRRATVVAIVALAFFFHLVQQILLPFVFAGIVAYVCTPLVDRLTKKTRWPRWTMATIVLLVLIAATALIIAIAGPPAYRQLSRIGADLQGSIESLARQVIGTQTFSLVGNPVNAEQIAAYLAGAIRDWMSDSGRVFDAAAFGAMGAFGFVLAWVLLGYILLDAPHIEAGLFWLVPPPQRRFAHKVWRDLNPVLRRYFIGVGCVVLYGTVAAFIGLGFFLGLRHAPVLALMTGVLEIIPIVGPVTSGVVVGLIAVHHSHGPGDIIAYVIYAVSLRISIDQFFAPIVLGRAAHLRPALVIFCLVCGGVLFGIVGILLAIPVALTVKATLAELYGEPEAISAD